MDSEPPSSISLRIDAPIWQASIPDLEAFCGRVVAAALAAAAPAAWLREAEIDVLLCDDAAIASLNARHRGIARPTNVLSFPALDLVPGEAPPTPLAGVPVLLGDIVVAHDTSAAEAAEAGRRLADHLAHLLVHGTLHLLGHDHVEDDAAEAMEAIERDVLATLGIADPYAEPPRVDAASEARR